MRWVMGEGESCGCMCIRAENMPKATNKKTLMDTCLSFYALDFFIQYYPH